jgi:quercetin dioxygenase-like cupin family protein
MGVPNTNLAEQLGASGFGVRLWRFAPGQASTKHRHIESVELYLLLEGTGRMRVGDELLTLEPLSAVLVDVHEVRQVFNDTDADALWAMLAVPLERFSSTLDMTEEVLAEMYPDGVTAMPPELGG